MPKNTSKFSPMQYVDRLYEQNEPALAFNAATVDEWKKWRRKLKAKVWELLGGMDDPKCDLNLRVVERKQMDGYVREKVVYSSRPEMLVPAWVLIPDGLEGRLPAVVACSGHGHGKDDLVGLDAQGQPRQEASYQNDFALQMVRRGFVVIAPEHLGFGERRDPWDIAKGAGGSCQQHSMAAMLFGRTNSGLRVYDVMRAIDVLQARPEVDPGRIGCLGISGGGLVTLFSAAMDERIQACLVSGYFNLFRDCIIPIGHCVDNYIPGLLRYAEMSDVASLVAPRAFFSESGTTDTIFPIKATREAFGRLQQVYELLGVPDKCGLHVFNGAHSFNGKKGIPFLEKWL
ncbi:MAG: alpha/beta hydrolase family protein [Armatimonadetes bacterium]|nr:alpha/beta hydrolase family protein [Armatimonadota bacterium]